MVLDGVTAELEVVFEFNVLLDLLDMLALDENEEGGVLNGFAFRNVNQVHGPLLLL